MAKLTFYSIPISMYNNQAMRNFFAGMVEMKTGFRSKAQGGT
jgi:hypothetical protein